MSNARMPGRKGGVSRDPIGPKDPSLSSEGVEGLDCPRPPRHVPPRKRSVQDALAALEARFDERGDTLRDTDVGEGDLREDEVDDGEAT